MLKLPMPRFLVFAAAALAAGACGTARGGPKGPVEPASELVVGDPALVTNIDFRNVRTRVTPNGGVEIEGTFVKRSTPDAAFQWRVEWLDASGFRLDDPTQNWQCVELQGIRGQTVKTTSVPLDVAKWRIHLKKEQ
ncbi:MAG: DUF1425 domain-containing protein [Planctomycetota bacterium]